MKKLWKHQQHALYLSNEEDYYAYFFEQGTGKTLTAVTWLRYRCVRERRAIRTLILCPKIVIRNWASEIEENSKLGSHVCCLTGTGKKRLNDFVSQRFIGKCIFITNYESLSMRDLYKMFLDYNFDCVIFDESHKLKSHKTARTKLSITLADQVKWRLLLTGTPILNSPMDIFSQYRILDRGKRFGSNFFIFRNRYFIDKNAGMPTFKYFPNWIPKPGMFDEFNKLIYTCAYRVMKHECLDLPPLIKQKLAIELSPSQRKYYDEMKKDLIVTIGEESCTAQLALTKCLRLQQLASGFLPLESKMLTFKDDPRIEALSDLLEGLQDKKTIVWAVFRENYKAIREVCDSLKMKYVELHGEVSKPEESVAAFQNDPEVKVLIGHPISGGVGVNLQIAPYAIWYSRNFSLEAELQAEARNYRGGSEMHEKVTRIDIVAANTIDEDVLDALSKKQKISERILDFCSRLQA